MQSMENRKYSRDNKRKNSNDSHQSDIISDNQVDDLDESSASDNSSIKINKKNKKIPLARSKTTYDNVNSIINKQNNNNNNNEDSDEIMESFRGGFTYTEEKSDENTSDCSGDVDGDDDVDQHEELPITEILRKAQQNSKIQYEEPTPLPKLTTDTIYIQGRNGFTAYKIPNNLNKNKNDKLLSIEPITYPIEVAIFTQKIWKNIGLICQGLLAGMSLMHFLFVQKFFKFNYDTFNDYSTISEIYTNLFSLLILICIISAFDKYDLAHLTLNHFNEIYDKHSKSIIAVPLYVVVFFLHQINLSLDDKLSLINYTTSETNSTIKLWNINSGEVETWKTLTLTKNGISVLAWLFISVGPDKDMMLSHLQSLKKYIDNN